MKREIVFRRQREEQMGSNLRQVKNELDRAMYEQSEMGMGWESEERE
jgi:hypothetical protein